LDDRRMRGKWINRDDGIRIVIQDNRNIRRKDQGFDSFSKNPDSRAVSDHARDLHCITAQIGSDAWCFSFNSWFHYFAPFLKI
jgi:hypothetical protein